MKNKILTIIMLAMLSLPVYVQAEDDIMPVEPVSAVNTLDEEREVVAEPETAPMVQESSPYKQPVSRRKIVKKFLAAMGGVAFSSFIIFFLLSVYNRIREGYITPVKTPDGETSLETPDDLDSAVKTFLDKTDWRG